MLKFLLIFCLTVPYVSYTQTKIKQALNNLIQDSELQHASVGFCAIDVQDNSIFIEHQANKSLIPASSMKVITTGTATALLGKNLRFETYLEYSGTLNDGVLDGDIFIRGTGDPSLASPIMEGVKNRIDLQKEFVEAVQKLGIQKINGQVVGDDSYFDDQILIETWQWGDIGNHYGAGCSGLNYHDNLYYIHFEKNSAYGAKPRLSHTVPQLPNFDIDNRVISAGSRSGDNAYVYAAPFGNKAVIRGTIPKGSGSFNIKGALPDPALICAYDLTQALKAAGIKISASATTQRRAKKTSNRTTFHTYRSPSLAAICKHTNEKSRNMYCEVLLKTIGAKKKGSKSTAGGIAALSDFWQARGLSLSGFFMKDGCGLSARNGVTAKTFAQMMRKMYLDKSAFNDFYNQLAIAGQTGTLKNFCKNSAADNNMRAKSGSMNRIRSFTGYVRTQSGKLLSFSILVNNYSCSGYMMKKKLETLLIALAES